MSPTQNNDDFIIRLRKENFNFNLDATPVLSFIVSLIAQEPAQQRVTQLVNNLHAMDVQIIEAVKRSGTEIAPLLGNFINTRIEQNRSALKLKSIFGFFKRDSIEKEASDLAFEEAQKYVSLVRLSDDPAFQRVLADRQRLLKNIYDELINMIENQRQNILINPQRLKDILSSWATNQNLIS